MARTIIDAHIHFDKYAKSIREKIIAGKEMSQVDAIISVSSDLLSCQKNLDLHQRYGWVKAAFGYHPEQALPTEQALSKILDFIDRHAQSMVAVGEVGLPYYLRRQQKEIKRAPYIELLDIFIQKSVKLKKPIVLHAIYEDADLVCDLLEKHGCRQAHFHWFKGSAKTQARMIENGYFISITPDLSYKTRTQALVQNYPLAQIMVETDGPWPFEGPFQGEVTHPKMIHQTIEKIAALKHEDVQYVYQTIKKNTEYFYQI